MSLSNSLINELVLTNIEALNEGAELLSTLDQEQYLKGVKPAFHSTIGAHFRHVLEHYRCFFNQLADGQLCYDARERDALLESDIDYALDTINSIITQLTELAESNERVTLSVCNLEQAVSTTLQRELVFLQSHTVHHYALIGAMVRMMGGVTANDFGIAIATREYGKETGKLPQLEETPICAQ